jgi:hypothetical protein
VGAVERLLSFAGYLPYRCVGCKHRFFRFLAESGEPSEIKFWLNSADSSIHWQRRKRTLLLYGLGALAFLAFLYFITRPDGF